MKKKREQPPSHFASERGFLCTCREEKRSAGTRNERKNAPASLPGGGGKSGLGGVSEVCDVANVSLFG